MGSVIDYNECPNCNSKECFTDFYYKTNEEYTMCPKCGYYQEYVLKRDENNVLVKQNPSGSFNFDNLIWDEKEILNPYGIFHITNTDNTSTFATLESKQDYKKFKRDIPKIKKENTQIKTIFVNRYINGKIEKELL